MTHNPFFQRNSMESFEKINPVEDKLEKLTAYSMEMGCRLDCYIDSNNIEHTRVFQNCAEISDDAWEIFDFQEGEIPLELLFDTY